MKRERLTSLALIVGAIMFVNANIFAVGLFTVGQRIVLSILYNIFGFVLVFIAIKEGRKK